MEHKNYKRLYSDGYLTIMKSSEDSLDPKLDRVDEIIAYCHEAGIKRIGIVNGISIEKQVKHLQNVLTSRGFKVDKAHCMLGKVKFDELVPGYKGTTCNPAGQADYLAEKDTQLNIMMGLWLGHDMVFNSKSNVPVTPLVLK